MSRHVAEVGQQMVSGGGSERVNTSDDARGYGMAVRRDQSHTRSLSQAVWSQETIEPRLRESQALRVAFAACSSQ